MRLKITKRNVKAKVKYYPTPIKDFINFKKMSCNEILLNLDNCENFSHGELIGGLLELAKRDKNKEFDWNNHAITQKCFAEVYKRLSWLNSKNVL